MNLFLDVWTVVNHMPYPSTLEVNTNTNKIIEIYGYYSWLLFDVKDCSLIQDSDGEKSDTDLVVDDVNNQMSPHNGDRRSTSPPPHSAARKTPGSGGSSAAAASSAAGMDKLSKRDSDQSSRERDTSSRASSGSASGKHRDVSSH